MTASCLVSIAAGVGYAFVESFGAAVAVSVLLGVGNALWFPSQAALLSLIVPVEMRPAVSAFQRASLNLGAALGGVLGGFLVRQEDLASFRVLFAVNVATYLVFLAALPGMPSGRVERDEIATTPGFREVLRDTFFVRLLGTDVAVALGFGFLFAFMPVYASQLGIDKAVIGVLFTFGAASVVLTQIPTLRWVRGGDRMRWLAVMNLWFAAAFVLMVLTPHLALGVAVVLLAIGQVLGGFGEAILGAVRQPLTADLAPPELMGRSYGLSTMVFQACMGFANTIGGLVMDRSLTLVWLIPLGASIAGVAATLALRRTIPAHVAVST
ncbi:MAG: MFS transporter [Ilumatobacteraceae bacterium]